MPERFAFLRLEDRLCPAGVSASLNAGILTVIGTAQADRIAVEVVGANLRVAGQDFAAASVNEIRIDARQGNDRVAIAASILLPSVIDGGKGNDVLEGGGGDDTLLGGKGNDRLFGYGGVNVLKGGDGKDSIDGAVELPGNVKTAAPKPGGSSGSLDASGLLSLLNGFRAKFGAKPLTVNQAVAGVAQKLAMDAASLFGKFGYAANQQVVGEADALLAKAKLGDVSSVVLTTFANSSQPQQQAYNYLTGNGANHSDLSSPDFVQAGVGVAAPPGGGPSFVFVILIGKPERP